MAMLPMILGDPCIMHNATQNVGIEMVWDG